MWRKIVIASLHGIAILAAWFLASRSGSYCASVATICLESGFGLMPMPSLIDPAASTYGADCMAGAVAARSFVKQMIADRRYEQLGLQVREMIRAGAFGGYEVGFFGEIARVLAGVTPLSTHYAIEHALDGHAETAVGERVDDGAVRSGGV